MMKIYFADNLRNLRRGANVTQKKLADNLGVDQRTVSAWEKGVCQPSFEMIEKLCEIFDEDFNGLLG